MSPVPSASGPGHEMSLLGHLEELRVRLVRCILAAVAGFAVCFAFAERILEVLLHPLKQVLPPKSELITTGLTEGFFVSMKAAFVAGIFLVSPIIFYQIWKFIAPGLYESERKLAIPVAFFTALCFVSGACFGYFIVFPYGFTFLANYAADVVTLMPKLSEYYSFSLSLLFAFGIIFEMPVFIFFLARFGIVDHIWLRKKRRWAIVVFFVVAAILTPTPDAVNQILMAAPMVVLYEVSIWVAYFFGKKTPKPSDENLPAPTDGGEGDGGDSPEGGPAPTDAALEEARESEAPALSGSEEGGDLQADAGTEPAVSGEGTAPGESVEASGTDGESSSSTAQASAAPESAAEPLETVNAAPAPEPAKSAEEAEREAHELAALGHDMDETPPPVETPVEGTGGPEQTVKTAEGAAAEGGPASGKPAGK